MAEETEDDRDSPTCEQLSEEPAISGGRSPFSERDL
jgi:hypothetical protein